MGTDNHKGEVTVDNSLDEMLETLDEFESKELTKSDVQDDLPHRARVENNCLHVKNRTSTPGDEKRLTRTRKQILRGLKKNPEATHTEVANKVGASETHVSRTARNFKFLLKNDRLYEAFVRSGLCSGISGMFTVKCDHDDCKGIFKRVSDEKDAKEIAEKHLRTWDHFPVIQDQNERLIAANDPGVVMETSQEEVADGMEMIADRFGSVPQFFAEVAVNGTTALGIEQETEDEQGGVDENTGLTEDEWFNLFRVVVDSDEIPEDLEKKIAQLI